MRQRLSAGENAVIGAALALAAFVGWKLWQRRPSAAPAPLPLVQPAPPAAPIELEPLPEAPRARRAVGSAPPIKFGNGKAKRPKKTVPAPERLP